MPRILPLVQKPVSVPLHRAPPWGYPVTVTLWTPCGRLPVPGIGEALSMGEPRRHYHVAHVPPGSANGAARPGDRAHHEQQEDRAADRDQPRLEVEEMLDLPEVER